MSQCHRYKGGTTGEAFWEQGFTWERGASEGEDFFDQKHTVYKTLKGRKTKGKTQT